MKNKFNEIFTPTLAKLTRANFLALNSDLSFAKGIDDIASSATIIPNQMMYSKWSGYWSQFAIFWENIVISKINKLEEVKSEYSVLAYTSADLFSLRVENLK